MFKSTASTTGVIGLARVQLATTLLRRSVRAATSTATATTTAKPLPKPKQEQRKEDFWGRRSSEDMEAASRWGELSIPTYDTATMSDDEFLAFGGERRLVSMAKKYNIYDDLFGGKIIKPKKNLRVVFGEGEEAAAFYRGNVINPSQMQSQPLVEWDVKPNKSYSFALFDIDGRLDGKEGAFLLWSRTKVNGPSDSVEKELKFLPPVPAKNTGYHRIVAVLFEGDSGLKHSDNGSDESVEGRYVDASDLNEFKPIAFSFAQTVWDESVSQTYRNIFRNMVEPIF
eukprot:m.40930 g.40930  ORF g.40930 m.40930 type:complete len:284 (+) comp10390_c0_seq1:64-915(+)